MVGDLRNSRSAASEGRGPSSSRWRFAASWIALAGVLLIGATATLVGQTLPTPSLHAATQLPATPATQVIPLPPGSAAEGERLFSGTTRLQNGGPACIACHSIAGVSFPNGGTLGPNLTGAYKKLGLHGMQESMTTLYFRVMTPIYDPHPLTLQEQSDLIAFFQEAGAKPPPRYNTQAVVLIAFVGFLILLAISGFAGRKRIKPVRRNLVERARRQGGRLS